MSRADPTNDAALLAGLGLGDAGASAAFVRRFRGAVYGLAVSVTRDPQVAEDVCQEVFLRAWRAAATYDARRASVLTWLLTITRNAAVDMVRARRSTPVENEALDQILRDTLGPVPALEEMALHRLETEQAMRRLHQISPAQARAVVLAVVVGCTAAQVASREGVPLGTAKTRIRSGLRRLRQIAEVHDA